MDFLEERKELKLEEIEFWQTVKSIFVYFDLLNFFLIDFDSSWFETM